MPIKIGEINIEKIDLESMSIAKVYVGSNLIWQQSNASQPSLMPTIAIGTGII